MRVICLFFVIVLLANNGFSQQDSKRYDWSNSPTYIQNLSTDETKYQEYILKMYRGYRYAVENDQIVTYITDHQIVRVKTTNAIERHNRIYVSMTYVTDLVELKARSVSRDGKVTNFDQRNLKEIKDDESSNTYRIFAIEGVEIDSDIEFLYIRKLTGRAHDAFYVQQETPIRDFQYELLCPKKLVFDFRVYNDDSKVMADTIVGNNRYRLQLKNIPGLHREAFAFYDAYRKRVDYKMLYNYTNTKVRLNTWSDAGRVFYRSLTKTDNASEKELTKLVKSLKDDPRKSPIDRVKNVEDQIKDNFRIVKSSDPALDDLTSILRSHQASTEGITKLLLLTYTRLSIPVQLVITCNREYAKFDGNFQSWSFLDEYLLYFPEVKGFLTPGEFELRYPLYSRNLSAQSGLFIEGVTIDNITTGIATVRAIPAMPHNADSDNLNIQVWFTEAMDANKIDHQRTFVGLDAASLSRYYATMSDEQKKTFVDKLYRESAPDMQMEKWGVNTTLVDHLPSIELKAIYSSSHFLEKAGPRTLFKVGDLIGVQSELYSEEKRQLPIENTHNRGYVREIKLHVPDGYKVANLESLKMDVKYSEGEQVPFYFVSTYTQQGNVITIKIEEFYKEIYAPLERYEDFRKVINAAADFNKVVLVLTKA